MGLLRIDYIISNEIRTNINHITQREEKSKKDAAKKSLNKIAESLKDREKELNDKHKIWNKVTYVSIGLGIVGIVVYAILFICKELYRNNNLWGHILPLVIFLILILFLLTYSFTIAKSYMHESLKMADRVHAMKSIQLFTELFHKTMQPEDLHKLFANWNLCNDSAFKSATPIPMDKILEFLSKIKLPTT